MIDVKEALTTFTSTILLSLFDEEYQRKLWVTEKARGISLDEFIMQFLDFCEPIINDPDRYEISKEKHKMLLDLYNMVDEYEMPPNSEIRILTDPKWEKFVTMQRKSMMFLVISKHGKAFDKLGSLVDSKSREAHIPLEEYDFSSLGLRE